MSRLSRYKLEKRTKQRLIAAYRETYDFKSFPQRNSISLLLGSGADPTDGSVYYPMPFYETMERLPLGEEHVIDQIVSFEGFRIGMTVPFQCEVDEGVICLVNQLIRISPLEEFDDKDVILGICLDS
jgi:hypothetical protein